MTTVDIALPELTMGASVVVLSKITPVWLKGYEPHIVIIYSPKGSVMRSTKFFSIPVRLVWVYWSTTNFSKGFPQAVGIVLDCWGKCHLLRLICQPHVFICFARIFVVLFAHIFVHTFYIHTCISLTIIIFVIFVCTFFSHIRLLIYLLMILAH